LLQLQVFAYRSLLFQKCLALIQKRRQINFQTTNI